MKPPERLRDDPAAPEELKRLIETASGATAPPAMKARIEAALGFSPPPGGGGGQAGPNPAPGGSTAGGVSSSVAMAVTAGLVITSVAIVVGVIRPWEATDHHDHASESPSNSESATEEPVRNQPNDPETPADDGLPTAEQGETEPSVTEPSVTLTVPSTDVEEPPARRARAVRRPPSVQPGNESRLLLQARRIAESNPTGALNLVRQHRTAFPRSQFASERDMLEVEALFRLGQHERARRLAARFSRRYPNSPHRLRLQALTDQPPEEDSD